MTWRSSKLVAFDTETTGTDPFAGDRVIEIGLIVLQLRDGRAVDRQDFSWMINPGIPIPPSSSRVHHIYDNDVANEKRFEEVGPAIHEVFKEQFQDAILVGQNLAFDLNMMAREFDRIGLRSPGAFAEVDTLDVSRKHWPNESSHRLGDLCKRFGVPLSEAHRATNDAAACGLVFVEMAARQQVPDELDALIDWAGGIGPIPPGGPIQRDDLGVPVFADGPHSARPIAHEPIYLQWMLKARERRDGRWDFRFPEATRRWVQRWLDVRATDRKRGGNKSFGPTDWAIDSCIVPDVVRP